MAAESMEDHDADGVGDGARPVVRFAPSPNGYLHLGHAYSAFANHRFAFRREGRFLLRIEDIDHTRARPKFERAIFEDLTWLGLDWPEPVRRQSEHLDYYQRQLQRLEKLGLLYPCFCTRNEISAAVDGRSNWPKDPDRSPVYPGTCRDLDQATRDRLTAAGKPAALRMDMQRALAMVLKMQGTDTICWREFGEQETAVSITADPVAWGDVILARKDIGTSYHIAVVSDDEVQGITDVIRGEDLFAATSIHRLLQTLLGFRAPNYRHHQLLTDESENKLSKSAQSRSLRSLRADGWTPEHVMRELHRRSARYLSSGRLPSL
jgi:glutamyl-Q tRNA(Asp) synthetase